MRLFSYTIPLVFSCLLLFLCQSSQAASVVQIGDDGLDGGNSIGTWLRGNFLQSQFQVPFKGWFDRAGNIFHSPEPDFWKDATALEGKFKEYADRLIKQAKTSYKDVARSFDDVNQRVQYIVEASAELRNSIALKARAQDFTFEHFSEELSKQLGGALEELREEFPPTNQAPGHERRREMVERALAKVEERMLAVARKFGLDEADVHKFFAAAGPHIVDVVTTTGDIVQQHPVLVTTVLSAVVGLIIPESLILRPIFSLFGFGPYGPVKGTAAAGIQRWLYGAAVPAGSWFSILQRVGMYARQGPRPRLPWYSRKNKLSMAKVESSSTVDVPVVSGPKRDGVEDRGWIDDVGSFFSDVVPKVIWGKVTAVSGDVGDFSKNKLQDMEMQFKDVSHHVAELQERMQHVLAASQRLRGEVSARATQHGFTIEDFSQELEGHWVTATEELKGMFDPLDEAPSHDDRLKLAESVFDKAGAGLVVVGAKFGIAESETGAFCDAARPHVVHIVTVIGDVLEQHPILLEVLLPLVLGWIIGEVWILGSLLRLFGFGPAGPVKGGVAAWIQRALFRGTVPAGGWFASLQRAGMKGVGKVGSTDLRTQLTTHDFAAARLEGSGAMDSGVLDQGTCFVRSSVRASATSIPIGSASSLLALRKRHASVQSTYDEDILRGLPYLPDGAQTNSPQQLSPVLHPVTRITTPPPIDRLDATPLSRALGFDVGHSSRGPASDPGPHAISSQATDPGHSTGVCDMHWSAHETLGLVLKSDRPADWKNPSVQSTQPTDKFTVKIKSLFPTYAMDINRYSRQPTEDEEKLPVDPIERESMYIMAPLTTNYDDNHGECIAAGLAGWKRVVHPEGALYWFHEKQRVFTDAPMANPAFREAATQSIAQLGEMVSVGQYHVPEDAELVLELHKQRSKADNGVSGRHSSRKKPTYRFSVGYYFVTHKTRRIFWLEEYNITSLFENLKGVTNKGHMGLAVEQQYWQHCEFFPYARPVRQNIIDELSEIVFHYMSEMITSDTSLTPFNEDELSKVKEVVDHAQQVEGKPFDHTICIIARLMRTLIRNRFFHFHGQTVARLNSDQPLFTDEGKKAEMSRFTRIFMLLLFNAPNPHLKRLRSVWIDKVVNQVPWKKFVDELNTEWKGYTLYSTVLLTVNLSLLALFNVMPQTSFSDNGGTYQQTVAEIMSYVSTAWSVGSVVTSLILVRQNETNSRQSIDEAVQFLNTVSTNKHGIEMLAIIYSLPFGFLLWGLLFFSMAFLALAFQHTLTATRVGVAVASLITLALVIWPVVVAKEFLTKKFWTELRKEFATAWQEKDVVQFLDIFGLPVSEEKRAQSRKQRKLGRNSPSRSTTRTDTCMTADDATTLQLRRPTAHGVPAVTGEEPEAPSPQNPEILARVGLTSTALVLGNTEGPIASYQSMNIGSNAAAGTTPASARGGASSPADPPARQQSVLKRASTVIGERVEDWRTRRERKMSKKHGPKRSRSRTHVPSGDAMGLGSMSVREQADAPYVGGPGAETNV
ncbi:hypothetical protein CONPUDRAFT_152843 [Coniophora puteana RWD-64-598 SS2]|uniref:Uncharacterized protein n=1 Tax=Coniophora puteana (strain RWD-64-598) TaxID=741705 RepID=A0A5M3MTT1_CONPW|nr:uncharacterized protein CONPUDRAFT_152843 [Coniophora puteana RWD-64-598 SS2]EIW81951.1 hypothetical protein CONPUDRAFT_152843 [Coniophora puteana RWD-64-598 SS2]